MDTSESTEDVDRLLAKARAALQEFEDNVDRKRLMKRLRSSSPAHPVLLFRFLFGGLFFVCIAAAVTLMAIATFDAEFARTLAKLESVIATGLPEEIPVLPALFGLLAVTMALAWATATLAALSLGREAQLLPWERKEQQNLVNEVTRLTTQRAVMERIRGTPSGARPRIATPVPLGSRARSASQAVASPPPPSASSGGAAYGGFTRSSSTPAGAGYTSGPTVTPPQGYTAPAGNSTPGFSSRRGTLGSRLAPTPPVAPRPLDEDLVPSPSADLLHATNGVSAPDEIEDLEPDDDTAVAGGVRLGSAPAGRTATPAPLRAEDEERTAPASAPVLTDAAYRDLLDDARPPGAPAGSGARPSTSATPGGILGRARAGVVGLRSTPFGSAGRVRPPGLAAPKSKPPPAPVAAGPAAPASKPRPRLVTRGGAAGATRVEAAPAAAPTGRRGGVLPTLPPPLAPPNDVPIEEVVPMEEEDELPTATGHDPGRRRPPTWGPIHEDWLRDAVDRSDQLLRSFPQQAYLSYSQEPHLPFTLVIARATPAAAVRAMASFVDFLASIATPPRARIELVGVAHLDRSFHKNVEAALEPHFGGNIDIEANPGRVDIRFTEPDPQWGSHPVLPIS